MDENQGLGDKKKHIEAILERLGDEKLIYQNKFKAKFESKVVIFKD